MLVSVKLFPHYSNSNRFLLCIKVKEYENYNNSYKAINIFFAAIRCKSSPLTVTVSESFELICSRFASARTILNLSVFPVAFFSGKIKRCLREGSRKDISTPAVNIFSSELSKSFEKYPDFIQKTVIYAYLFH